MSRVVPIVGITADFTGAHRTGSGTYREATHFLPDRYCRAVEGAGAVALILPATSSKFAIARFLDLSDGLLISGGDFDIHPSFYGEKPIRGLGVIKQGRTEFELDLTAAMLKRDLPILGLCGGAQAINVAMGGTLYQDIPRQLPKADNHQQSDKKRSGGHRIHVRESTKLREILHRGSVEVNTTHHQAIKRPGTGLIVNAIAEDGLIEGIESVRHSFVMGLQWHPEALSGKPEHRRRIFKSFVLACKQRLK